MIIANGFKIEGMMMVCKRLLFGLVLIGSMISCKKADELTQFRMEFNQEATIPSSTGVNLPFNILVPENETNASSTFESNNTRKDLIEEILIEQLDITITSPSNGDFSFLKSVGIYLSAEGLEEIRVAWLDDIPDNVGNYINLELSKANLKDYLSKPEYSLRLNTVTDEIITSDHKLNVHSKFFVDAKLLGV